MPERVIPETKGEKISGMGVLIKGARSVVTGTQKLGDGTIQGNEKPAIEKAQELEKAEKKAHTG